MIRTALVFAIAVCLAAPTSAATFLGTGSVTNANDAFADWQAATTSNAVDDLRPLNIEKDGSLVTPEDGSAFKATSGTVSTGFIKPPSSNQQFPTSVVALGFLLGDGEGGPFTFTWRMPGDLNAFGFFTERNSGVVTVSAGSTQLGQFDADDQAFWGITGLAAPVRVITISTTDTGTSRWDNFAYGQSPVAPVPLPATLPMLLAGLGMVGLMRRQRKA